VSIARDTEYAVSPPERASAQDMGPQSPKVVLAMSPQGSTQKHYRSMIMAAPPRQHPPALTTNGSFHASEASVL